MARPRFLPAGDEAQLLRAAVLHPEEAVRAWHSWHAHNDIDKTPQLALDLSPPSYRNIGPLTDDEHSRGILHGTYRRAWLRNQVNMNRVAAVIERLNASGIDTLGPQRRRPRQFRVRRPWHALDERCRRARAWSPRE